MKRPKNPIQENSGQILATISKSVENKFGDGQQYIITYQASSARKIRLINK